MKIANETTKRNKNLEERGEMRIFVTKYLCMNLLYRLGFGISYLLSMLPLRVLYVASDIIYLILYRLMHYRYEVVHRNVMASFPHSSAAEQEAMIRGFYHWLCDYFVETLKMMSMSKRQMQRRMQFIGTEEVNRVIAKGQSAAIYLGHYGQWEWITSLPFWVSNEAQCAQIYHPLENKWFDKMVKHMREKRGAVCISMSESLRKVVEYRQKNIPLVLGYISDQVPFWNNIHHWVDFMHQDTPVLTGTERMIKRLGQAVFYADVRRERRGYYTCEFKLITTTPQTWADFQLTDRYFECLQASIEYDPNLYLWSHNRWKRTREEFNLRYDAQTGRVDLRDLETIMSEKREKESKP